MHEKQKIDFVAHLSKDLVDAFGTDQNTKELQGKEKQENKQWEEEEQSRKKELVQETINSTAYTKHRLLVFITVS